MKLIEKNKGMKDRGNAVKKLRDATREWEQATNTEFRALIISNPDGTFTPAVLCDGQLALARSFAEQGIYVIG